MKPYEQGALDGLCAVYSIVNATRIVAGIGEEEARDLFKEIILYLERTNDLGKILTEGIGLKTIGGILGDVSHAFQAVPRHPARYVLGGDDEFSQRRRTESHPDRARRPPLGSLVHRGFHHGEADSVFRFLQAEKAEPKPMWDHSLHELEASFAVSYSHLLSFVKQERARNL